MKLDITNILKVLQRKIMNRAMDLDSIFWHLYDMVESSFPGYWLYNLYLDESNEPYAIISNGSEKAKVPIAIGSGDTITMGAAVPVTMEWMPVTRAATRTRILRMSDDTAGWFSVSATSTINRDNQIDSRELFDSFIDFSESTGFMPVRTFFHLYDEDFITGQAMFLARSQNCYLTAGQYFDNPQARAEIAAFEREPEYWGESIGFLPTRKPDILRVAGVIVPVWKEGINFEISTLPESMASSLFTNPSIVREVNNEMADKLTKQQTQALARMWNVPEDELDKVIDNFASKANEQIRSAGFITRENGEEAPAEEANPEEEVPAEEANPETAAQAALQEGDIQELFNQVGDYVKTSLEQFMGDLTTQLEGLKASNAELRQSVTDAFSTVDQRIEVLEGKKRNAAKTFQLDQSARAKSLSLPSFAPTQQRQALRADDVMPPTVEEAGGLDANVDSVIESINGQKW